MKRVLTLLFAALIAGTGLAACTDSTRTQSSAGEYVDDSAITSKVKSRLLQDAGMKSLQISVETYKNEVQLSGFVNESNQKSRATEIAQGVPGVKAVRNDLIVK